MSTAIYLRVSSNSQSLAAQKPDLQRWAAQQETPPKWFSDKSTGTNMDRPGWEKLMAGVRAGQISRIVVWRLDRLGRTVGGLATLFDELAEAGVDLVSLREGISLATPAGRLMCHVIASVAQYETEVRSERQRAGIEAVRTQNGGSCPWGGSQKGRVTKRSLTPEDRKVIGLLAEEGMPVAQIARRLGKSRTTIKKVLA